MNGSLNLGADDSEYVSNEEEHGCYVYDQAKDDARVEANPALLCSLYKVLSDGFFKEMEGFINDGLARTEAPSIFPSTQPQFDPLGQSLVVDPFAMPPPGSVGNLKGQDHIQSGQNSMGGGVQLGRPFTDQSQQNMGGELERTFSGQETFSLQSHVGNSLYNYDTQGKGKGMGQAIGGGSSSNQSNFLNNSYPNQMQALDTYQNMIHSNSGNQGNRNIMMAAEQEQSMGHQRGLMNNGNSGQQLGMNQNMNKQQRPVDPFLVTSSGDTKNRSKIIEGVKKGDLSSFLDARNSLMSNIFGSDTKNETSAGIRENVSTTRSNTALSSTVISSTAASSKPSSKHNSPVGTPAIGTVPVDPNFNAYMASVMSAMMANFQGHQGNLPVNMNEYLQAAAAAYITAQQKVAVNSTQSVGNSNANSNLNFESPQKNLLPKYAESEVSKPEGVGEQTRVSPAQLAAMEMVRQQQLLAKRQHEEEEKRKMLAEMDPEKAALLEKRERNSAASARFRKKKKLEQERLENEAERLFSRLDGLEEKVAKLEAEKKYLENLVALVKPKRRKSSAVSKDLVDQKNGKSSRTD
eukprot:Nk52_evm6s292 gene=Nk52_evmTU6s292